MTLGALVAAVAAVGFYLWPKLLTLRHPSILQQLDKPLLKTLPEFSGDYKNEMLWGSYRSGLYFGMRTRCAQPGPAHPMRAARPACVRASTLACVPQRAWFIASRSECWARTTPTASSTAEHVCISACCAPQHTSCARLVCRHTFLLDPNQFARNPSMQRMNALPFSPTPQAAQVAAGRPGVV